MITKEQIEAENFKMQNMERIYPDYIAIIRKDRFDGKKNELIDVYQIYSNSISNDNSPSLSVEFRGKLYILKNSVTVFKKNMPSIENIANADLGVCVIEDKDKIDTVLKHLKSL